ncbi:PREDICTED: ubiquitin-like protein ATG12 [Priapulus caudatus]|uniref:Ubiquitin-like protein ATG12 n=1 Tax=Priapulus caudatus TaxID=37621 RepID=A0ABM1E4H0_PRICU|nr:PREDICTED: ubiquitin-like protein ATG12 [Priapulus caudatus]
MTAMRRYLAVMADTDDGDASSNPKADEETKSEETEEVSVTVDAEKRLEPPTVVEAQPTTQQQSKISILMKAAGDAPILKVRKWAVDPDRTLSTVIDKLNKILKTAEGESVFVYVNQSFAPSPDHKLGTLQQCFGSDGKLVLHYCKSQAWG